MSVHSEVGNEKHALAGELDQQTNANNASPSKEEVLSQMANIATIAALIGGFALSTLTADQSIMTSDEFAQTASMLLFYLAVHACTCSAVGCFWLYRIVAAMDEVRAVSWAKEKPMVLAAPAVAFGIGAMAYIFGVIVFTLHAVGDSTAKSIAVYMISALCGGFIMTLGYNTM